MEIPMAPKTLGAVIQTILLSFAVVAVGLGFWQIAAAHTLTENPELNGFRRIAQSERDVRGRILDREGQVLAETVTVAGKTTRRYQSPAAGPVTGYVSSKYGSVGVESVRDGILRGQSGQGFAGIADRVFKRPIRGGDVVTTIDRRVQDAAVAAFAGRTGAAVVIDPRNGEVLALVSSPFADPNRIESDFESLRSNAANPLFNRAISGLYVPGSVFKVVVYATALADGVITPSTQFEDPDGGIVVDRYRIPDPNHPGVPKFDAAHALSYSSNSAFASIGLKLGGGKLREGARRFLFESEIPFELPIAVSTLSTNPNALASPLGQATTAIGQHQLLVTPFQMALVAAAIANKGTMMRPNLLMETRDSRGSIIDHTEPRPLNQVVSANVAQEVTQAMTLGVRESWARTAALPGVAVAGKTGTAETDADAIPHAWFIAFAPADAPRVAVAVVLEHAGGGSTQAGPVVKAILETALRTNPIEVRR